MVSMSRIVTVALLALASAAFADVPRVIAHEGRLLRADGSPERGGLALVFSLYESATGGAPAWTETQAVTLSAQGYYAVRLGAAATLPAFDGRSYWLGIGVQGEPEMTPRMQVSSVAYAIRAGRATDVDNVAGHAASDMAFLSGGKLPEAALPAAVPLLTPAQIAGLGGQPGRVPLLDPGTGQVAASYLRRASTGGVVLDLEFDEAGAGVLAFADTSPLGNGATTTGAGAASGFTGHAGNAVNFTGGVVVVPSGNSIPDGAQVWVEAWINPPSFSISNATIVGKPGAFALRQIDARLIFDVTAVAGSCTAQTLALTLIANQWNHVAGWYDGLSAVVAVGGVIRSVVPCGKGPLAQTAPGAIFVGAATGTPTETYLGLIDEVRVRHTAPDIQGVARDPFPGSVLLSHQQKNQLNRWIGNPGRSWRLCYRKAIHGASTATWAANCHNKGPSVTVMDLASGKRIGGYTPASFGTGSEYRSAPGSFLYTLTGPASAPTKRYPLNGYGSNYAIYIISGYGPSYGHGHDISMNSASMDINYCNFPYAYSEPYATPSSVATQELCGVNLSVAVGVSELEMWVFAEE